MHVTLIRPNVDTGLFKIFSESLALGYLSAILRENHINTDIIDAYLENIEVEDLVQRLTYNNNRVVGFTIYNTTSLEWTAKASRLIKKENPEIHIIIGGYPPSFDYEYILQSIPEIDSIARFEGEYIILDLVKALHGNKDWRSIRGLAYRNENKVYSNKLATLTSDLDRLPQPHRDYLPYLIENYWEEYTVYVNRGRGCNRKCTFCNVSSFFSIPKGKNVRQKSNKKLLDEIENLVDTYNVNNFTFIDDIFSLPSKEGRLKTIELATEIERRQLKIHFSIAERINNIDEEVVDALKLAGLVRIFVGLEAVTQRILDRLDKGINKKIMEDTITWLLTKKIDIEISFINFLPFNTLEDTRENVIFFSQWGIDTLKSIGNRLEPYPGTLLYFELENEGNLRRDGFSYDYITNTVDTRVDILYGIINPSIQYLAFVSYKLRLVKTFLWKVDQFVTNFEILYNKILNLQKVIVFEVRNIFLNLIESLEKNEKYNVEFLREELNQTIISRVEWWLSCLIEIRNRIKQEVNDVSAYAQSKRANAK
ncbi:MAG: radical SAM protein [Deltaproteobacteria bacterium]|nr:radical SAM protein [Deltaproteobacteria bacterium]